MRMGFYKTPARVLVIDGYLFSGIELPLQRARRGVAYIAKATGNLLWPAFNKSFGLHLALQLKLGHAAIAG